MITKHQQTRLELGSAEAIVYGKGLRRHVELFPCNGGYCEPTFMKAFIELIDSDGKFIADSSNFYTDAIGRVVRLNYYAKSTTKWGASPDKILSLEEFLDWGKPFFLLRNRQDVYIPLRRFNQKVETR